MAAKAVEFIDAAWFKAFPVTLWGAPWFSLAGWLALLAWWFQAHPTVLRGPIAAACAALLLVGVLAGFGRPRWTRPAWYWRHEGRLSGSA